MAEKKVSVRLAAEGGRIVRAELEGIGRTGDAAFRQIGTGAEAASRVLKRLAGVLAGALSARQIVAYADAWTDLRSRVDLATGSQARGAAVMERLAAMARRTYSGIEQTTESWLANATALRELGLTTKESLDFTEALNNAMVVSGAKAERAASVQNALSKAMALGKLSGDNLNTVIQTGGRVAELLAKELGTTVSGLRKMGVEGRITGEVIRTALVGNLELLRDEADSMPATIADAFTLIGNAALQLVGRLDQLLGASSLVADALILVADNLDHIAVISASFAAFMAGRWVIAFVAARVATFSLATALVTLRAALIRTGIGALIVAAGELVYWLGRVVASARSTGDAFYRMYDVAREVFLGIGRTAWGMSEILAGIASGIAGSFVRAFAEILRAWDLVANGIGATWNLIADTKFGDTLGLGLLPKSDTAGTVGGVADALFAQAAASVRSGGGRIVDAMASIRDAMGRSLVGEGDVDTSALDDAADSAGRLNDALDSAGKAAGRAGAAGRKAGQDTKKGADEALQGWAAVSRALTDYASEATNTGKGLGEVLSGAFKSAESAFRSFATRGKVSFRELISSILADLATLQFKQGILGPLAGLIGGMFGDPLTAALRAAGAPVAAGIFHTGGVVGAGGLSRTVPALAFVGAPRMHKGGWPGLKPDEVPAILQRGERVLSRRDAATYGAGGDMVINVNVDGANGDRHVMALVSEGVRRGLSQYDKALPGRIRRISERDR